MLASQPWPRLFVLATLLLSGGMLTAQQAEQEDGAFSMGSQRPYGTRHSHSDCRRSTHS